MAQAKNLLDADLSLWKPSLHEINSWRQRAGLPKTTQEEFDTFMITFLPHYAPEIRSGRLIENKIYAKYIQWVKDDALKASRLTKAKPAAKQIRLTIQETSMTLGKTSLNQMIARSQELCTYRRI